jgi:23S rRNA pseudouridine2605 synthase
MPAVVAQPVTDFLSRALARAGVLPAREAEAAVRAGRVTLNGRVVRQPLTTLKRGDVVRVDGRAVSLDARTLALAFHKPPGCVTSHADPQERPTVFDLLSKALPKDLRRYGWHAVGRLDVDTTGLLLFTNDEHLVAHATRPETKLPKRYLARVQGRATSHKLAELRTPKGAPPVGVRVRAENEVELTIAEGSFHQVKRMLGAVGLPVLALHREAVGLLELDVPLGSARLLTDDEISRKLRFPSPAGGRGSG